MCLIWNFLKANYTKKKMNLLSLNVAYGKYKRTYIYKLLNDGYS